jgi:hypothetical protein
MKDEWRSALGRDVPNQTRMYGTYKPVVKRGVVSRQATWAPRRMNRKCDHSCVRIRTASAIVEEVVGEGGIYKP